MALSSAFASGSQAGVQSIPIIPLIIGMAVTLIQCFFGFKLFRYIMGFWGFSLFGFVGYTIGSAFGNQTAAYAVCFVLGAVGAFIAYKFYKAGVFLQGLIAGFFIGVIIALFAELQPGAAIASGIVLGILLGLLTTYILKYLIILTSAVSGGMASGGAIAGIFKLPGNAGALIGILLSVLGIGYQFYTIGKEKGLSYKKNKEDKNKAEAKDGADEASDIEGQDVNESPAEDAAAPAGPMTEAADGGPSALPHDTEVSEDAEISPDGDVTE